VRNESRSVTGTPVDDAAVVGLGPEVLADASTRYGRPSPPEYTDPSGSAPTICTAGFCDLR